jgi:hypothetical protein
MKIRVRRCRMGMYPEDGYCPCGSWEVATPFPSLAVHRYATWSEAMDQAYRRWELLNCGTYS